MNKTRKKPHYTLAIPTTMAPGVLQAANIWVNYLYVHETKFENPRTRSEKELSIKTWQGCTDIEYDTNTAKYQNLNNAVIDYIRENYKGTKIKIDRIRGRDTTGQPAVTKICRPNKKQALDKQKSSINNAAGRITSALAMNEIHQLNTNVGVEFFQSVEKKVDEMGIKGLTTTQKDAMIKQLAISQAIEAGRKFGAVDIATEIVSLLDEKPALIQMDQQVGDEYAQEANQRRTARKQPNQN